MSFLFMAVLTTSAVLPPQRDREAQCMQFMLHSKNANRTVKSAKWIIANLSEEQKGTTFCKLVLQSVDEYEKSLAANAHR